MHFKPALLDNCVHPALQAYLDVFLCHHRECRLFLDHKNSEKLKNSHRMVWVGDDLSFRKPNGKWVNQTRKEKQTKTYPSLKLELLFSSPNI